MMKKLAFVLSLALALSSGAASAAGTASALSIKDDVVLRDLDIHTLQNQLVADGVRIR